MDLLHAQEIADSVVTRLRPRCSTIEVAGSIRRGRPFVNDIDLVLTHEDRYAVDRILIDLATEATSRPTFKTAGKKIARLDLRGISLDVYYATPETWATLLLIRTGSKRNNIRLATRAWTMGWRLHASGDGLVDENDQRIAGDTEESIYQALGLPFQEPKERE